MPSSHSFKDGTENPDSKTHDLGGRHVLVADEFVYFGGSGPDLPTELEFLIGGRGHRCRFTREQVELFTEWINQQQGGIRDRPTDWPPNDESWRGVL